MNKLEGVNKILRASGKLPAPALDTGGSSWAGMAERIIDIEDLQVQTRGWHYNTREKVTVSPTLYTFDNASWTAATKRLAQTDAFTAATVGQTLLINGSQVVVAAVDTTAGAYVDLATSISATDLTGVSGSAVTNRIVIPSATLTVDGNKTYEPLNITQEGGRLYNLTDNTDMFSGSVIIDHVVRYEFHCLPLPIRNLIIERSIVEFLRTHGPADRLGVAYRELETAQSKAAQWETQMQDHNVFETASARRLFGRSTRSFGLGL